MRGDDFDGLGLARASRLGLGRRFGSGRGEGDGRGFLRLVLPLLLLRRRVDRGSRRDGRRGWDGGGGRGGLLVALSLLRLGRVDGGGRGRRELRGRGDGSGFILLEALALLLADRHRRR